MRDGVRDSMHEPAAAPVHAAPGQAARSRAARFALRLQRSSGNRAAAAVLQRMPPPQAPNPSRALRAKPPSANAPFAGERPPWVDLADLRLQLFERYKAAGVGWISKWLDRPYVMCAVCAMPYRLEHMQVDHVFEWSTIHQRLLQGLPAHAPFDGFQPYFETTPGTFAISELGARAYYEDVDNLQLICGGAGESCNQKKNSYVNDALKQIMANPSVFTEYVMAGRAKGEIAFKNDDPAQPLLKGAPVTWSDLLVGALKAQAELPAMVVKLEEVKKHIDEMEWHKRALQFITHSRAFMPAPMTRAVQAITPIKEHAQETVVARKTVCEFLEKEKTAVENATTKPQLRAIVRRAWERIANDFPALKAIDVEARRATLKGKKAVVSSGSGGKATPADEYVALLGQAIAALKGA